MPRILIVDDNAELLGLLSSVFEEAGYTVLGAQRARQAMERAKIDRPDVAVVDVLLPDVMGHEVAALLKQLSVPFVLVSGVFKGGRHGLEAVQRHGAFGYFEKPFDVERLVEKVASVCPPAPVRKAPPPVDEPEEELVEFDVDLDDGDAQPDMELTGRVSITDAGKTKVSATLSGDVLRVPVQGNASVARPVVSRPERTPRPPPVVAPLADMPFAGAIPTSRTGELHDNLPQLINAFYLAQETGELVVQRGVVKKVVYFERGAPVFATSNLSTDRFGQFLVRVGKVQANDLAAAAHVADRTKKRTGDVLIEMGQLTDAERMYFVGQQVKAIIYSLFAWEDGHFTLAFARRARAETLKLDLHPANLIIRGVKKLYSPARLQRQLSDAARPIPSQDPSYLLSDVDLEAWEAQLLSRVDGTKSVADLAVIARRTPDQIRGLLVGLTALRILEIGS